MNPTQFGSQYSGQYDLLYTDKNYGVECDALEAAFRRFAGGAVRSVLDMGCGTGGHAIPLAKRGYRVTGVDRSAGMLQVGREKAEAAGVDVTWLEGDVRRVEAGGPFDAVTFMFAVLGYQLSNVDVLAALTNTCSHLRPGGLLVFDVWFGPAVLSERPGDRIKVIESDGDRLIRAASGSLNIGHHLCNVSYRLWRLSGDRLVGESEELHQMRFFFPLELELFLNSTGFELVSLSNFPDLDSPADEKSWNVLCVARRN